MGATVRSLLGGHGSPVGIYQVGQELLHPQMTRTNDLHNRYNETHISKTRSIPAD